jgi:serine/threonine protein kinase
VVDGLRVQLENEELVVKLNGSQCKVLMMKLVQTVKGANVASVPHKGRVYRQSCKAVLQELYRVVKDAEAIIRDCCDKNWVQAAIRLVNMDEVFVDVLFRLDWCTSALGIVIQRGKSGPSSELQHVSKNIQAFGQVEQARAKMQEIRQMLRGHAREDRTTLRRRLDGLQKGRGAPVEQEIVAMLLKFTDPAANNLLDEMPLASSLLLGTMARTVSWTAAASHAVFSGLGGAVAEVLAVVTAIALPFYRLVHTNLVMMSRMDFPAISSTVLPGRNWLHSVKSQDLKDQKIISKGVAEVSEVKWLGRTFARKFFKLESPDKFMLVAEKFARLSHPHVLQVFGHSVELGRSPSGSLVMEPMYGDLKKLGLASRQLLVAVDTLLQVAEGMKYLHEQDIVHGDLNATNILINRVPIPEMEEAGYVQAKVAGFGVSGEPRTGTAGWMAPELFEEQNSQPNQEQFKASDIYSYAVTCFEILTSESPFAEAKNQAEVRAAVKAGARPHLPDSLPTSLQSLIRRCWDANASNRPSFSEICAELRQCKCDLMLNGDATLMEGYVQATFTTYSKGYQLSDVTMNSQTKLFSVLVVKFHGHIIHACILHVVLLFLIMYFSNFANTFRTCLQFL